MNWENERQVGKVQVEDMVGFLDDLSNGI